MTPSQNIFSLNSLKCRANAIRKHVIFLFYPNCASALTLLHNLDF